MEGLSKSFGEKKLFSGLDLTVTGGERIALIGDNGTGKSTLVKLIMGDETPDAGYVYRGPAVRTAYLPQMVSFSVPERSAYDTMLYDCRCQPQEARDRLRGLRLPRRGRIHAGRHAVRRREEPPAAVYADGRGHKLPDT